MANPNQNLNEADQNLDPTIYKAVVTRKVKNPFTGKDEVAKGELSLPLALTVEDAMKIEKMDEASFLFWYNHGRKLAARAQVNSALEFDLGSEELNDAYKSFNNAFDAMITEKTSPERRKKIRDFMLDEEKFESLRDRMKELEQKGIQPINVDFSAVELKKPSGQRGRPAVNPEESKTEESAS